MRVILPSLVKVGVVVLLAIPVWAVVARSRFILLAVAGMCGLAWALVHVAERTRRRHARRFLAGQCPCCGYDLRAAGDVCPECGSAIWTPDRPLAWPDLLWPAWRRSTLLANEEVLRWMLQRRAATTPEMWGDDEHVRTVASLVTRVCWPDAAPEPYGRFRPDDPFAVISSETSVLEFAEDVHHSLHIVFTPEELAAYESLTLGEVVNDLAHRSRAAAAARA